MSEFNLTLDSSVEEQEDGDAPEELTFDESKETELRRLKEALEATKREKQQLKEKRRRRHELFQEQKKRRLLPDDVLEEIEEAPAQEEEQDGDQAGESGEEDDGDGVGSEEETDASGKIRTLQGGYTVRTVDEHSLAASQQCAATDFVRDRLYGPGSRRITNKELLSLHNKRAERKAPSAEFVKKGWGELTVGDSTTSASKHKAKAERLKQRWIHRQQLEAS
ncbi:hypothetical protein CRUP_014417 [Coryphaenoides rupestris]|nr:hypothetical protein CRUP_014417 [Coryphaenoides rupestris]